MSGMNGDKARFNTYRRRKLAKRQRVWAFFSALQTAPKATVPLAPKRVAAPAAAAAAPAPPAADAKPKRAKPAPAVPQVSAPEKKPRAKKGSAIRG